jgi:hypothetical protein
MELTRAQAIKALVDAGADPRIITQIFPLHFREPTILEQMKGATQASQQAILQQGQEDDGQQSGPEGQQTQPGQAGPQQNALMPSPPPAVPGQEPQIGQPGGLPLGPGVGPGQ